MKVLALRHCSLLIGVIFAGATLVAPSHATAFELFGIHLWGEKKADEADETIGEPQEYTVDFVVTGEERDAEKTLKGASSLWKDRKKPASGAAGLLAKARSDYRRLLAALYGQGRYGGTISILVDGREAADLPPDATVAETAAVSHHDQPRPRSSCSTRQASSTARRRPASATTRCRCRKTKVSRRARWRVPASSCRPKSFPSRHGDEQGHAKANIVDRRVTAAHDNNTVDAIIEVDPGRKAYYDDVAVEGTERMDPAFVAWMTGLKPGQEYDPDDIERANRRLSRLDVFRALRIRRRTSIDENGRLPLTVIVQERKLRRFGVGGSYSTLDGLGLRGLLAAPQPVRPRRTAALRRQGGRNIGRDVRSGRTHLPGRRHLHQAWRLHARHRFRSPRCSATARCSIPTRAPPSPGSSASTTCFPKSFPDSCSSMAGTRNSRTTRSAPATSPTSAFSAGSPSTTATTRPMPPKAISSRPSPSRSTSSSTAMRSRKFTAEGRTYYGFGEENRGRTGRPRQARHPVRLADLGDRTRQAVLRRRRRVGARLCLPQHRRGDTGWRSHRRPLADRGFSGNARPRQRRHRSRRFRRRRLCRRRILPGLLRGSAVSASAPACVTIPGSARSGSISPSRSTGSATTRVSLSTLE